MTLRTRLFAVATVAAVAVGWAVPAQAATGAIHSVVLRADGGDTAIDGCVELYTPGRVLVASSCGTLAGETLIDGLEPGTYRVRYVDFTGLENLWHGAADVFEESATVTVSAGGTTELVASLETAATIRGVFGESVDTVPTEPLSLYDVDGRFIDTTYAFEEGGVFKFHFEHVPEGSYKLRYVPNPHVSGQWYKEPGDFIATPIAVAVGQTTESLTLEAPEGGVASFAGPLNTPAQWDPETVCAVAVNDENVALAIDCGTRGGRFTLDVPANGVYGLAFVAGPMKTPEDYASVEVAVRFWPNSATFRGTQLYAFSTPGFTFSPPIYFFADVFRESPQYWNIKWMGDAGISKGYSDETFRPTNTVRRHEMALFLYRFAGQPPVAAPGVSPFTDVSATSSSYPAIYWLNREGLSTANPFRPNEELTRRQVVMFLYRLAGAPEVKLPKKSPFKDVKTTDVGYTAIVWADQQNIAEGYWTGDFRPAQKVLRRQVAAFLSRYDLKFG